MLGSETTFKTNLVQVAGQFTEDNTEKDLKMSSQQSHADQPLLALPQARKSELLEDKFGKKASAKLEDLKQSNAAIKSQKLSVPNQSSQEDSVEGAAGQQESAP